MNLLDLIFPKRCLSCGRVGKYFCVHCASMIRIIRVNEAICPICEKPAIDGITHPKCQGRYTMDGLTSFFHYDRVIQKAVKAIKYRFISDIAEELLQQASLTSHNYYLPTVNPQMIIVPVPLHKIRYRYRGFNQAQLFARILAKTLNLPTIPNLLIRTKLTVPQVEVKQREKRLKNMEGVFSVNHNNLISQNPNIFLVDDVFTTGATMRSAANVLKRAGAKFVWGISIAR